MIRSLRQLPASCCGLLRRRLSARLVRVAAVICAVFLISVSSPAQPKHAQRQAVHHRQKQDMPPPVQPTVPPAPQAPPKPNWPANAPPAPPSVTYDSKGLQIVADNSSLSSILDQVSTQTGAKVEGLSTDERVFGDYGPGQPRAVLADLLSGVDYNVLILGDEALGEPLKILLSPRPNGPAPPSASNSSSQPEPEEEFQPEEPPYQPPYQPPVNQPPINRPPTNPQQPFNPNQPMTPQQRMQMIQERQREFQQQQQQQQQQPQ